MGALGMGNSYRDERCIERTGHRKIIGALYGTQVFILERSGKNELDYGRQIVLF